MDSRDELIKFVVDYNELEDVDYSNIETGCVNGWFSPLTLPSLVGLMRGSILSVVYFHIHYVCQAF